MAEPNSNRMYIIIGAIVVIVALLFFFMSGGDDPAADATATDGERREATGHSAVAWSWKYGVFHRTP